MAIKATIGVHLLLLLIDRMPLFCVSSGVIAQLCYTQLLRGFPFVALSEPRFLASSIMLVVNHCVWMQHFLHSAHSVEWVICFFFIVVWMVPFGFMMSLASTDSMLPGAGSLVKAHQETKGKGTKSSMLQLFSFARAKRDVILPKALEAFQTDPRKGHGE